MIGKPAEKRELNLGNTLNIFPPNRDMRLKREARILPIKKAVITPAISFFFSKKLLERKVSVRIDPIPINPEAN